MDDAAKKAYWRSNVRVVSILLVIWALVSYGAGIFFADALNEAVPDFLGFPLGFWFAQQGSIYVFVVLIFVYTGLMQRLDRSFGIDEDATDGPAPGATADDDTAPTDRGGR